MAIALHHDGLMRIATVLSSRDLPPAELQAGLLDGELMRVGGSYCAIDTVLGSTHRAASLAAEVPLWSIAERWTAAWVYGLINEQPLRLQLSVRSQENIRPLSSQRCAYREVVLSENETVTLSGLRVTTPLRTALDMARIDAEFSGQSCEIVAGLSAIGRGFTLDDCRAELTARTNLPFKRMAIDRLSQALRNTSSD